MNMAADNREIARQVVEAIGGRENIASFAHCATRLRIMVHDQKKIDQKKVEQIDKVKGAFFNSGQYQIIFGTGTVNQIFEAVESLGMESTSKEELKSQAKSRAIRFSGRFVHSVTCLCRLFRYWSRLACSWGYEDC